MRSAAVCILIFFSCGQVAMAVGGLMRKNAKQRTMEVDISGGISSISSSSQDSVTKGDVEGHFKRTKGIGIMRNQKTAKKTMEVDFSGAILASNFSQLAVSGKGTETQAGLRDARDSLFLIYATFGPTRKTLSEKKSLTDNAWIRQQIRVSASSHREYYRARTNPETPTTDIPPRDICTKGSRWINSVFRTDEASNHAKVQVRDGKIYVNGEERTILPKTEIQRCTDNEPSCSGVFCEHWWKTFPISSKSAGLWGKPVTVNRCADIAKVKSMWKMWPLCQGQGFLRHKWCQKSCFDAGWPYFDKGKDIVDDCSGGWANVEKFDFRLCPDHFDKRAGAELRFRKPTCYWHARKGREVKYMPHPELQGDGTVPIMARDMFQPVPGDDDAWLLVRDASGQECKRLKQGPMIKIGGIDKFAITDHRGVLRENTPANPIMTVQGSCTSNSCTRNNPLSAGMHEAGFRACTPPAFVNRGTCKIGMDPFCQISCGSPGEGANVPTHGHLLPIRTKKRDKADEGQINSWKTTSIYFLDSRRNLPSHLSKSVVWTSVALESEDQLRQRVAWALAQVVVVGASGFVAAEMETESWLSFYDIMVRNAFGNFQQLLLEVTYSPTMANYLTYRNSMRFDSKGSPPDENYAREIMQLFSVGPELWNANGTKFKDADNASVPTYTTQHIMNFARVFTGFFEQPNRSNIEATPGNLVDPMIMESGLHDQYPKPDLAGGYLGDRYPLCSDLPQNHFLQKGATYEYMGESGSVARVVHLGLVQCSGLDEKAIGGKKDGYKSDAATLETCIAACRQKTSPTCVYFAFRQRQRDFLSKNEEDTGMCILYGSYGDTCQWKKQTEKHWRNRYDMYKMVRNPGSAYQLPQNSKLLSKLQSSTDATVMLDKDITGEAQYWNLTEFQWIARAGQRIFRYSPPACVYNYFSCDQQITILPDGQVSSNTGSRAEATAFPVQWHGNPALLLNKFQGDVQIVEAAVFDQVPNEGELLQELHTAAFAPSIACTHHCNQAVKAYSADGQVIDEDTVFELNGRFFKNTKSIVKIYTNSGGRPLKFRNPPTFFKTSGQRGVPEDVAAHSEVASLIEHLARHTNTPFNIGKKMIQRFTMSNPPLRYLQDVAAAFRTGTYNGETFSGQYGDLGAMMAAILLHPEAQLNNKPTEGALREPMLKIIHIMRSLEYKDKANEPVVFVDIIRETGQFPYFSPTVFNFYDADFMLMTAQPGPELELEPLNAPEFQILTAPFLLNMMNGIFSMLENGLSACDKGFGQGHACKVSEADNVQWFVPRTRKHEWPWKCPDQRAEKRTKADQCHQGEFRFNPKYDQLNHLLTGGRVIASHAAAVQKLSQKEMQKAMVLTPEFHNLGDPLPRRERVPSSRPAPTVAQQYKALVLIFMAGGADTFNMIVPQCDDLYASYSQVRGGVSIPKEDLLPINAANQKCKKFGLHPKLANLHKMYQGTSARPPSASFISNIGSLVYPATKMNQSGACPNMGSHSHWQRFAQTLNCRPAGGGRAVQGGIGGRVADAVASAGLKTTTFSISGKVIWTEAIRNKGTILTSDGAPTIETKSDKIKTFISEVTETELGNVLANEYSMTLSNAITSSENLNQILTNKKFNPAGYDSNSKGLSKQLRQVATLMLARKERKASRDFFYVLTGGWDMHANINNALPSKLEELDRALGTFVRALIKANLFEETLIVTASEFGRTLTFNGAGTDHAWAGNHIIIGGDVAGGTVHNEFLGDYRFGPNNDQIADTRGRVVPKYPWESLMVPVAKWLGVSNDKLDLVFPNLKNFDGSDHIIDERQLFKNFRSPTPAPTTQEPRTPMPPPSSTPPPVQRRRRRRHWRLG